MNEPPDDIVDAAASMAPKVTMTRDEQIAEANRRKAALKRVLDREKAVQAEVRGSGDIRQWFAGAKMRPQFVPLTNIGTRRESAAGPRQIRMRTEAALAEEQKQLKRELRSAPGTVGRRPVSFLYPEAGHPMITTPDDPELLRLPRHWQRVARMLLRAHLDVTFDCGDQPQCRAAAHRHSEDDSPLGRVWHARKSDDRERAFECRVPVDPFDTSAFPLARFVGTLVDSETAAPRRTDPVPRMATSETFSSAMLRLRELYHTQLANVLAKHAEERAAVKDHFNAKIVCAQVAESADLERELRTHLETALNRASAELEGKRVALRKVLEREVVTTVHAYGGQTFHIAPTLLVHSLIDAVTLENGRNRNDRFYLSMFANIANGQLEVLEQEKQHVRALEERQRVVGLLADSTLPEPEKPATLAQHVDVNTHVTLVERAEKRQRLLDAEDRAAAAPEVRVDESRRRHLAPVALPKPHRTRPTLPQRIYTPGEAYSEVMTCVSQTQMDDAGNACTAIAFNAALRIMLTPLAPNGTTPDEQLMCTIDWGKLQEGAAVAWRAWRKQAPKKEECMLACEVPKFSGQARSVIDKYNIQTVEMAGLVRGESALADAESAPTLKQALARARKLAPSFGAVLTLAGSSYAIGAKDGIYYLYDSHGKEYSVLFRFLDYDTFSDTLLTLFTEQPVPPVEGRNETTRMSLNSYSLYVLYLPLQEK